MVSGINTNVEYGNEVYHVQTEDCGVSRPLIKTIVFFEGGAVATVETSYAKLARSPEFSEQEVARRVTAQHWKTAADLRNGRLYLDIDRRSKARRAEDRHKTTPVANSRADTAAESETAAAANADAAVEKDPAGATDGTEAVETEEKTGEPAASPSDLRPPPPMSDRRVTMLAIALAAVSMTLAVFTVLSLIPLSGRTRYIPTDPPTIANRPPVATPSDEPPVCAVMTTPADPPSPVVPATLQPTSPPRTNATGSGTRAVPPSPAEVDPPAPRPRTRSNSGPPRAAAPSRPKPRPAVEAAPVEVVAEDRHDTVTSDIPTPTPEPPPGPDLSSRPPAEEPIEQPTVASRTEPKPVGPFELTDVDVPPRLTSQEMPAYTKRARRKGQEGTVALNLLIDERGMVSDLRLKRTIPDSDLNEAVLDIIRTWRFDPARKAGVPVSVWKPVTIEFSIIGGQRRVRFLE
jgi:protein TonB